MMVSRDGAFGVLIGAAVGTFLLVPAHGAAQDSPSPSCAYVSVASPLQDLIRCAELGNPRVQLTLGLKYASGDGVTEDDAEAVRWFRVAADGGHARAQFNLAVMYASGDGVAEDDAEAVRWFRAAADQGHVRAQYSLGVMYGNGDGVAEDDAEAARWYQLAADQGHAEAALALSNPSNVNDRASATAVAVALSVFGANPMAHAGMLVTLQGLPVQALVGSQAFFALIPRHRAPYLVKMLPEVVVDSGVIEAGATVSVTGMVYAMSDSVANAWVASGGVTEADRVLAVFAESFFEAASVTVVGR